MNPTIKTATMLGAALALMLILACAGAAPANPGDATPARAPTPEPLTNMAERPAPIETVDIQLIEGSDNPAQLVVVSGVPNGCIRYNDTVVSQETNAIAATVTNLVPADPNIICAQVYGTNESHTDLAGEFDPCNTYTVVVNGQKYAVQPTLNRSEGTGATRQLEVDDPSTVCGKPRAPVVPGEREHVQAPIEDVQINAAESLPVQYFAVVTVGLPNACYDFGEATVERDGSIVRVSVTNLGPADPGQMCAEIYRTVVKTVALGSDFDPNIAYTVEVNGKSYPLKQGGSDITPQPAGPSVKEVPAPIESVQINITNRQTGQATLTVVSGLPDGCAKLVRFDSAQSGGLITVTALNSIPTDPNITCTAIYGLVENETVLTGSYTACDTYAVEVNGETRQVQAIAPAVRCRAPETPTASQDRDRVPAPIENVKILATRSLPPQYTVVITAGLPNACYDSGGYDVSLDGTTVRISVVNLAPADPNTMCAEVYRTVDVSVPLGSDFEPGIDYTVEVNGKSTPLTPGVSEPPRPSPGSGAAYGSPFALTEGGAVNVGNESFLIRLESVEDSRCPANVVCVWQGQAVIVVSATLKGNSLGEARLTLEPQQTASATADLGGFRITFVSLEPYPDTEGQTTSRPTATLIVEPKGAGSSGAAESEATVRLSAQPVDGSPLTVHLIANIVGGPDNAQNLYCQGISWSFGDGKQVAKMPGCFLFVKGSTFNRHWEETHRYEKHGTYEVSFTYGPLSPATVRVKL